MKSLKKIANKSGNKKGEISSFYSLKLYFLRHKNLFLGMLLAMFISSGAILFTGIGMRFTIDNVFGANESIDKLNYAILFWFGIIIILAFAIFARYYCITTLGERVVADIKRDLFKKVLKLSPSFYSSHRNGDIMNKILVDTEILRSTIGSSISIFIRNIVSGVGALSLMLITNFKLASIVLLVIPLVIIPIIFLGRKIRKLSRLAQDKNALLASYVEDAIFGIKVIQAFTYEIFALKEFNLFLKEYTTVNAKRIRKRSILTAWVIILVFSSILILVRVGGSMIIHKTLTTGELTSFVWYSVIAAISVGALSEVYGEIQRAAASVERIDELLQENDDYYNNFLQEFNNRIKDMPNNYNISFNNISFSYKSNKIVEDKNNLIDKGNSNIEDNKPNNLGRAEVLKNISFTIKYGDTVAIVGESGAGKSTIFDLLLRFYKQTDGKILLDNIDINELDLIEYRKIFSLVSQDNLIFATSAKNNILISNPNATDEEVVKAAKLAEAHNFIMEMEEGYDSFLGESGVQISGGEKQRIAIARALIRQPKILLLDEATSSLDNNNEDKIQQAIDNIDRKFTIIVIAHRLSTIINADKIIYLEKGEIIEQGTHKELFAKNGAYTKLYKKYYV